MKNVFEAGASTAQAGDRLRVMRKGNKRGKAAFEKPRGIFFFPISKTKDVLT